MSGTIVLFTSLVQSEIISGLLSPSMYRLGGVTLFVATGRRELRKGEGRKYGKRFMADRVKEERRRRRRRRRGRLAVGCVYVDKFHHRRESNFGKCSS